MKQEVKVQELKCSLVTADCQTLAQSEDTQTPHCRDSAARMKMKKLLCGPVVMLVVSELVITTAALKLPDAKPRRSTKIYTTPWTRTTGSAGQNLNGKMFTLSINGGGVSFYPPYYSPTSSPWPSSYPYTNRAYTTRSYFTTTRPYTTTYSPPATTRPHTTGFYTTTYPPWTTTAPTRGVSVCLRYLTDQQTMNPTIFTLSPSSTPLRLTVNSPRLYILSYSFYQLYLQPDIRFWSNIGQDIWTRVCLTVDTKKKMAQMFSGSNISIRKMLPIPYVWSGEPVIDFSGFDGQMTDVQLWDYPLRTKEIFNYMTSGVYVPYRGSVLTWSSISYSPRGNTLLEDTYEAYAKKQILSRQRGHQSNQKKKTLQFFNMGENTDRKQL